MAIDFALKDFYRKKSQTYPYVLTIMLVISLSIFFIYFSTSLGLNLFVQNANPGSNRSANKYFFSGSISLVYSQFNTLILVLVIILSVIVVIAICTTLFVSKKRDIAIMKALGTLPDKLYWYYLVESFIIIFFGFLLGFVLGLAGFGIFALIAILLGYKIIFQFDLFYTLILFFLCILGDFIVSGTILRRIGNTPVAKSFSKDVRYNYSASEKFTIIPRWLSKLGFGLKIAIGNVIRRKGEFYRNIFVFTFIFLIIFTLGIGSIVLSTSSQEWIRKAQDENIVIIGHEDVVDAYSEMYKMYSDPTIYVDEDDIDFFNSKYLFNFTEISEIESISEIRNIDRRLIKFCDVEELDGYNYYYGEEGGGSYEIVGQQRKGNFPIIGIYPDDLTQDFEIEGRFFDDEDSYDNMTIGDSLAYDFFDSAFDQSMLNKDLQHRFHISGVVVDSFYNGYVGYVGMDIFKEELNFTGDEVNVIVLKLKSDSYKDVKDELDDILTKKLGQDFTYLLLDEIFDENIAYLSQLTIYPLILIIIMCFISILSLYNYQKAGLYEKVKDFLIMRAIGSKKKLIKRILFLESLFMIIPSIFLSLGLGMIINSVFLIDRAYLPPLYIPLIGIALLFGIMVVFIYISILPIIKKIDKFTIKDFDIY